MANLISDENLTKLLDQDILETIGGKDLSQEKKEELYARMAETIQNRAIARIYDQLSKEDGKELDRLIEANDQKQVDSFLQSKSIDLTKMLLEEAVVYKTEMIELYRFNDQDQNQTQK